MGAAGGSHGVFIALEGVEGSGKSTQTRLLAEWLAARDIPHVVTREPGGTDVGERARRILLEADAVEPRAELLLMLAARAALVEAVVRPALEAGAVVVTDRWALSTLAYQGHGRGLPLSEVAAMNAFATGGLAPDLTVVLDVDLEVGVARLAERGGEADRFEREGRVFHERVAGGYHALVTSEPGVVAVDGGDSPAAVHAAVLGALADRFPETFHVAAG